MAERGSTTHSPRVDDALEHEVDSLTRGAPVEARSEEWRQMEAAAEGEPKPDAVVSVDQVELRSTLAISLRPSALPADRERLLEVAREEHAEDRVVEWLAALPAAAVFANVQSVWEALGGAHESRDHPLEPVVAEPAPHAAAPTAPAASSQPAAQSPLTASDVPGEPAESEATDAPVEAPADGGSLIEQGVRIALAGAAVVVGLTIEVVRVVLRKR
jgi:uncharacterized protein DUF2795